jgi:hypothetical protein
LARELQLAAAVLLHARGCFHLQHQCHFNEVKNNTAPPHSASEQTDSESCSRLQFDDLTKQPHTEHSGPYYPTIDNKYTVMISPACINYAPIQ